MRSRTIAVPLAVAVAAFTAACGGADAAVDGPDAVEGADPPDADPVEIDFLSLAWQPGAVAANQEIVEQWNAENPDITVNLVQGDWDSINDQLTSGFEGGTAPDLFHFEDSGLRTYAERGNLLDLEPYLSEEFIADIPEATWQAVQYDGLDGTWGVPFLQEPIVLYADTGALTAAGARIPTPDEPWTWEEFATVARDLSGPDVYGAGFSLRGTSAVTRLANVGHSLGAQYLQQDGDTWSTVFGDGEAALPELLRGLIDDGAMSVDVVGLGTSDMTANFLQGRFVTFFGGAYIRSQIVEGNPSFDWATLPAPVGDNATQSNVSQTISVAADTEHPEEAVAFLEYFLNPENQVKLALGDWLVPTSTTALDDPTLREGDLGWDVAVAGADNLEQLPYQRLPRYGEWADAVAPAFLEYFTGAGDLERLRTDVVSAGDAVLGR